MKDTKKVLLALWPLLAFIIIATYTWGNLTTKPRPFFDEGLIVEVSRNFNLFHTLDVQIAPGQFSGLPYVAGSSGFPVSLPLAFTFHVFGFSLAVARLYALGWILIFLCTFFFIVKKFFNTTSAVSGLFLIASFAPFYDNALRVSGEIPGITFLLVALYVLYFRKKYVWGGVLAGLSMASRPSIYLLAIPAFLFLFFIKRKDARDFLNKSGLFIVGIIPSVLMWIFLAIPHPFSLETWRGVFLFYKNPFGSQYVLTESVVSNLKSFFSQQTLIYFSLLWLLALFSYGKNKGQEAAHFFAFFIIAYGVLDVLYFLKSPGWLRYLLPIELLTFACLFPALAILFTKKISYPYSKYLPLIIIGALVLLQGFHLWKGADIYAATDVGETVTFVESHLGEGTVGVISSPQIASLLPPNQTYHFLMYNDVISVGDDPLRSSARYTPTLLVMAIPEGKNPTLEKYTLLKVIGRWGVFKKK